MPTYFQRLLLLLMMSSIDSELFIDPQATLECHRRVYTFRATRTDSLGRRCWDLVSAMSCWGRCDSGEIADWRFPYKRPFHPVCVHEERQLRRTALRHCDPEAHFELRNYEYYEAVTCACLICESSTTSCEGIPYSATKLT